MKVTQEKKFLKNQKLNKLFILSTLDSVEKDIMREAKNLIF